MKKEFFTVLIFAFILLTGCSSAERAASDAPVNAGSGNTGNTEQSNELRTESNTPKQEKNEDKGIEPKLKMAKMFSRTKKLGEPIEISGTLSNPNPFPISHVEVSFWHVDAGETKEAVLFEDQPVPPKAKMTWKVSVTFEKGHLPEALIIMGGEWKKAQ